MAGLLHNKILVAVDGSEHAVEMVRYASKTIPSGKFHVILFHVVANLPESFHDFEKESAYHYKLINTSPWEAKQQEEIGRFMDQARRIFLDEGFAEDSVTTMARIRKVGIARDVIEESQSGYDAVIVGRKGLSPLKDLVMGSIATKLVEKLAHVPVWVVGDKLQRGKILVCLDKSEGAMQAVDYVGKILGASSSGFEVTLFHVITDSAALPHEFGEYGVVRDLEQEWIEMAEKRAREEELAMESVLESAGMRLVKAGFDPARVSRKIVRGVGKKAGIIAEEAQQGGYDTIVVGRRGLSKVQEFIMGRVSNKVIDLAKDRTVWVVS